MHDFRRPLVFVDPTQQGTERRRRERRRKEMRGEARFLAQYSVF